MIAYKIPMTKNIQLQLKKVFPGIVAHVQAYKWLFWDNESYLKKTGWMNSLVVGKPQDFDGNEIPWMNYAVVSFLEDRLDASLSLFEYGSGFSTKFYACHVLHVTSLEYDSDWYEAVKSRVPKNVQLLLQKQDEDGRYCRAIHQAGEKYDVVVIDGRDRVNCLKQAVSCVSERGVLLLDDSQREWYGEAIDYALQNGFRKLDFEGLKPTGRGVNRTTIFYRNGNCLGI